MFAEYPIPDMLGIDFSFIEDAFRSSTANKATKQSCKQKRRNNFGYTYATKETTIKENKYDTYRYVFNLLNRGDPETKNIKIFVDKTNDLIKVEVMCYNSNEYTEKYVYSIPHDVDAKSVEAFFTSTDRLVVRMLKEKVPNITEVKVKLC